MTPKSGNRFSDKIIRDKNYVFARSGFFSNFQR